MKTSFYEIVEIINAFDDEPAQLVAIMVYLGIIFMLYFFGFTIA